MQHQSRAITTRKQAQTKFKTNKSTKPISIKVRRNCGYMIRYCDANMRMYYEQLINNQCSHLKNRSHIYYSDYYGGLQKCLTV